jgi:hypothetical protein
MQTAQTPRDALHLLPMNYWNKAIQKMRAWRVWHSG